MIEYNSLTMPFAPEKVCNHWFCTQRDKCKLGCKIPEFKNSVVFIPTPAGSWENCKYFKEKGSK